MAKKNTNKTTRSKDIENAARLSSGQVNPDFENHLNRILRNYRNQGKILDKIKKIRNSENSLTNKLSAEQQKILNNTLKRYEVQENIRKNLLKTSNIYKGIMNSLGYIYNYLEQNDGTIKSSAISLGLSRSLSDQYRENLLASSKYAARLGLSLKELSKIQEGYTAETGQSALLSAKALEAVTQITQGTGLSAENTGTLVGQFKLLGLNAENTKDFVELTAKETSKLGINLNKVLSDISSNFKTINSYNFSNGINGVQKMAMYANMYKINMQDAFASMEKSRTLEGAVEMSAKLMVMGGEFSKQNMFELGFLARNKPEEFIKKLNEMNRSVYHFNSRTNELESSAFDLDRLRAVAEATGVPFEELNQQARRIAEIDFAKSKLTNNLSSDEKDFIANLAQFNKTTGKFEVTLGRDVLDIRSIGRQQIIALQKQDDSLDKRAKDALTFDKEFRATIEELKTTALPLIKNLNDFLRSIQQFPSYVRMGIIGISGAIVVGGAKLATTLVTGMGGAFSAFLGNLKLLLSSSSIGGGGVTGGNIGKSGKGFMGKLGGAAGGAMAVGGAFLAASYGITMIAESFKELNPDQLNAITTSIVAMGIAIPASLFAISSAATIGLPGLGIFAGALGVITIAALGIGKGIEFAATGLGNMFSMITPDIVTSITEIGWGIGKIGLSLMTFGNPMTMMGIAGFTAFLTSLSLNKNNISNMALLATSMSNGIEGFKAFGDAMDKVKMVNNDSTIDKLRKLVSELNNIQVSNPINELKEILSKPLKVEFADNNIDMVVNISNILDGKVIAKNIYPHIVKLTKNNSENK